MPLCAPTNKRSFARPPRQTGRQRLDLRQMRHYDFAARASDVAAAVRQIKQCLRGDRVGGAKQAPHPFGHAARITAEPKGGGRAAESPRDSCHAGGEQRLGAIEQLVQPHLIAAVQVEAGLDERDPVVLSCHAALIAVSVQSMQKKRAQFEW